MIRHDIRSVCYAMTIQTTKMLLLAFFSVCGSLSLSLSLSLTFEAKALARAST